MAGDQDGKNLLELGNIQLMLRDGSDEKSDLILGYWHNEVNQTGKLTFPTPLKALLDLAGGTETTASFPAHIAQFSSAALINLSCLRCGGPLGPVSVRNRPEAQQLWKDRFAISAKCTHCWDRITVWIKDNDNPLPGDPSLLVVLTACDLRGAKAYGDLISGKALQQLLKQQGAERLTQSVLVPHSANDADALVFTENEQPSYYIAQVNWKFAGEGSPAERRRAFEAWLDERLENVLEESFDDVAAAAAAAIENEVLRCIQQYLEERSFPFLDAPQQARVRQMVRDYWGVLSLGNFFSIVWSAARAATDIKAVQPQMGRASTTGYMINEFGRGIDKVVSGEWERREYGPHRKMPYADRSLTLFRTFLGLDILAALPSDIQDLRPGPDPYAVQRNLLEILIRRSEEMGGTKATMMEAFTRVYRKNLEQLEEPLAFRAAMNGMDYIEEFVPAPILQDVVGEITDMRDTAETQALRSKLQG